MFSFFKSKKNSPTGTPPESEPPIPSADSDEFIFVDKKEDSRPTTTGGSVYPPLGPYPPNLPSRPEQQPIHALHGVPFKLSPEITNGDENSVEITKFQVNEISSSIGRINLDLNYDFAFEKEIISQVG